jgi:hypothetical protein
MRQWLHCGAEWMNGLELIVSDGQPNERVDAGIVVRYRPVGEGSRMSASPAAALERDPCLIRECSHGACSNRDSKPQNSRQTSTAVAGTTDAVSVSRRRAVTPTETECRPGAGIRWFAVVPAY